MCKLSDPRFITFVPRSSMGTHRASAVAFGLLVLALMVRPVGPCELKHDQRLDLDRYKIHAWVK